MEYSKITAEPFQLPHLGVTITPFSLLWAALVSLVILWSCLIEPHGSFAGFPVVNGRKWYEITYTQAKQRYQKFGALPLIKSGLQKSSKAFWLFTDHGYRLILSPMHAKIIRNDDRLSFRWSLYHEFHGNMPGFDIYKEFAESSLVLDMIKTRLTTSLDDLIVPISKESTHALQRNWEHKEGWQEYNLKDSISKMVAQVTGRVFLGDDTCRDPIWLNMNITYTDQVVKTAKKIRLWPKFLLPVVGKFLPASRRLQRTLQECEDFLQPLISQRKTSNEPRPQLNAIDWFEELSKGQSYNPTISILKISLVSLDTTSELLFHVIRELSTNESLVNDLRSEILTVFPGREIDLDEGFNQQDLKKLKLLDSAIKESQRRSHRMITLRRFATEDVTLDDGTRIPKGTQVAVAATHVRDTSVYEDGDTFNGYRFLNAGAPLVVPTPNHMGFGYGKQACPGRFFVSVEMKILLCKMLLNYDFSMDGLDEPKTVISGYNIVPNPQAKIAIRHRAKATCVTYQEN